MKNITRKILIISLIISISLNILILPRRSEAMAVMDFMNYIPNYGSWIEDIMSYVEQVSQWIEEKMGKQMRDVIAKEILDYIVDETIKWVQGGGEPKFVGNWEKFLKHAGNTALDQIINDLGTSGMCSPFKLQVRISTLPTSEFSERVGCTLDDVVGDIENFYQDFENGGWAAYNKVWEPQGNYYGTILMVYDELLLQTAAKIRAAEDEAVAGGGYLSAKDGTGQIETPGSTIGATVNRAVQTDMEWASNIESWLSALINAAINRLTSQGISHMKGSAETYTTYYPSEYEDLVNKELEKQQQQLINEVKRFADEWQYLIDVKSKTLSVAEQLRVVLTQIEDLGCGVSAGELQKVDEDINRLKAEISVLSGRLYEANSLIEELTNAKTAEKRAAADASYNAFMDKYNVPEFQGPIADGSNRKAADKEFQDESSALSAAQQRLDDCLED